jgi:hypothetical protein
MRQQASRLDLAATAAAQLELEAAEMEELVSNLRKRLLAAEERAAAAATPPPLLPPPLPPPPPLPLAVVAAPTAQTYEEHSAADKRAAQNLALFRAGGGGSPFETGMTLGVADFAAMMQTADLNTGVQSMLMEEYYSRLFGVWARTRHIGFVRDARGDTGDIELTLQGGRVVLVELKFSAKYGARRTLAGGGGLVNSYTPKWRSLNPKSQADFVLLVTVNLGFVCAYACTLAAAKSLAQASNGDINIAKIQKRCSTWPDSSGGGGCGGGAGHVCIAKAAGNDAASFALVSAIEAAWLGGDKLWLERTLLEASARLEGPVASGAVAVAAAAAKASGDTSIPDLFHEGCGVLPRVPNDFRGVRRLISAQYEGAAAPYRAGVWIPKTASRGGYHKNAGLYPTAEEAARAYDSLRVSEFGEAGRKGCNFPDDIDLKTSRPSRLDRRKASPAPAGAASASATALAAASAAQPASFSGASASASADSDKAGGAPPAMQPAAAQQPAPCPQAMTAESDSGGERTLKRSRPNTSSATSAAAAAVSGSDSEGDMQLGGSAVEGVSRLAMMSMADFESQSENDQQMLLAQQQQIQQQQQQQQKEEVQEKRKKRLLLLHVETLKRENARLVVALGASGGSAEGHALVKQCTVESEPVPGADKIESGTEEMKRTTA